MRKRLFFILLLTVVGSFITAQNRYIARGAEPGELYISGGWYGTYEKIIDLLCNDNPDLPCRYGTKKHYCTKRHGHC